MIKWSDNSQIIFTSSLSNPPPTLEESLNILKFDLEFTNNANTTTEHKNHQVE
jgi:hypothetical protein